MVIITYINKSVDYVRKATEYDLLQDGWYILKDESGEEVGRAQAKEVRSIRKGTDEDDPMNFGLGGGDEGPHRGSGPKFSFPPPSKMPF
jgi:hypothetical protein